MKNLCDNSQDWIENMSSDSEEVKPLDFDEIFKKDITEDDFKDDDKISNAIER